MSNYPKGDYRNDIEIKTTGGVLYFLLWSVAMLITGILIGAA